MDRICVGKGIILTPSELEEKIRGYLSPEFIALHEGDALTICDQVIKILLGRKYSVYFLNYVSVIDPSIQTKLDYWGYRICFVGVCKEIYHELEIVDAKGVVESLSEILPRLIPSYQQIQREDIGELEQKFQDYTPGIKTFS